MGELTELFTPETVAVVGATERPGAVGRAITENLLSDFDGDVVAVNPNAETVLGEPCVDRIGETDADLAVVVVPADVVLEVVEDAGASGVDNVVVITAGFSEAGGEGAQRERRLRELAAAYDIDLVGPNCLGIISTPNGLNATFSPENAHPGSISFMSQSGAFITAVLDWAVEREIGFKDVVSLGNEAVLDETDFADHWASDPETDVIIGYLEGISDGRTFIETARTVTAETPMVLVKSGRTSAGARAASSHTGTLAGSEAAYEAAFDQAGVLRAESVQELFDAAGILAGQPLPTTDGVAVITNAGGPGVMATDAIGDSGLDIASFTDETVEALEARLPTEAAVHNPVDVLGDADVDRFGDALRIVLSDPHVGAAVVLSAPTAVVDYDALATAVTEIQSAAGVPMAACLMGGPRASGPTSILQNAGIPNYFDPARAVKSLDALATYRSIRSREYHPPMQFDDVDREAAWDVLSRVSEREHNRLGVEAMALLDAYGIPRPAGDIVHSPDRAMAVATDIDGPVAMKIVSPDVVHKSDVGGVAVDVELEEVPDTYERIVSSVREYQPEATIRGVQVQAMVDIDGGVETIVGVNRDSQFGPLLMFGLGGIFVEVLGDTTVRVAPISDREGREMTEAIQSAPLLRGARGRPPVDLDGIVETLGRLSQLVTDFPAIVELDINPLVAMPADEGDVDSDATETVRRAADASTVCAVDLRLTVDPDRLESPESDSDHLSDTNADHHPDQ